MKTCPNCRAIYPNHFAVCPRDAIALVESDDWSEGTIIRGKYRILSKVGQGGMGAVYKVLHTKFDHLRALKVMNEDMAADPDFVKRFEREAVIMSKLQHPNVVRVDDIDEAEDGRPFIVMEFVEGRSLRQVVKQEGPLQPLRVCSISRQAAAGLGAAHVLGMVHRDVKPENIVLVDGPQGEIAKVLDFGIAKLKEARLGDGLRTATGIIIGTPQYLSPEQAMGTPSEELDGRSDLYSLGLVMYQMLTSNLPFQADSAVGWMMVRLNEPPRPIQSVHADLAIPGSLANLVMRCLERERDLRPADARDLIAEIERVEMEIQRPAQAFTRSAATAPASSPPGVEPVSIATPLPQASPRAISTAPWARGSRFWLGLVAFAFAPVAAWPISDVTIYSANMGTIPTYGVAIFAAVGAFGWWLLTRRHWAFRVTCLLPLGFFALALTARVTNIYAYHFPHTKSLSDESTPLRTLEELKKLERSPLEISPLTLGVGAAGRPVMKFNLQNVSSDARVTDWKAEAIYFDGQGRVLKDESPNTPELIAVDPGKAQQVELTGEGLSNTQRGEMVLKEVDYQLTTPAGTQGSWINPHFQEDLEKAKRP